MTIQVLLLLVFGVAFCAFLLIRPLRVYLRFRGRSVVTCPDTQRATGVTVDARHAALSSMRHEPELRLSTCTSWPEKQACGAPCLGQIAAAPEDCLVRNLLTRWYEGKTCARCHQPFGNLDWSAAKPAALMPAGESLDWDAIPAETLRATLETAQPLCFACHTATRMVREHPELVTDRSQR